MPRWTMLWNWLMLMPSSVVALLPRQRAAEAGHEEADDTEHDVERAECDTDLCREAAAHRDTSHSKC